MKAYSVGLEVEISLSEVEVSLLRTRALEGILRFREVNSEAIRDIPLKLNYVPGRAQLVSVNLTPEVIYFGLAEKIDITIQDYLYHLLTQGGSCVDRFFGATGKVLISRK